MTAQIDTAIQQLTHALNDFNAFLETEAAALASQDAEKLGGLLPRRNELHRILASRWLAVAQAAGIQAPKGMAELRGRLFPSGHPSTDWERLEALVHASDRLNQVNGHLMEAQMRRTQVALQILQNSMASRGLYGADGRVTDIHSPTRKIDSA
jgi:flagellar biosynthesis/type III secretory pathway chaperone